MLSSRDNVEHYNLDQTIDIAYCSVNYISTGSIKNYAFLPLHLF
jgi:hypothetical protein